jgi:hypothetical protein
MHTTWKGVRASSMTSQGCEELLCQAGSHASIRTFLPMLAISTIVVADCTQPSLAALEDIAIFLCKNPCWIEHFLAARFEFIYQQPDTKQRYARDRIHGDAMMGVPNKRNSIFHYTEIKINGQDQFYTAI